MRIVIIVISLFITCTAFSQTLSLDQAVELARKNNLTLQSATLDVEGQRQLKKTSFDLPKTEISMMYGQYNSYAKNDNNITVSQSIPFSSLGSQGRLNRSLVAASELKKASTENELVLQVKQTYFQLAHAYSLQTLLLQQDSIFEGFYRAASLRYKSGETNLLEQTTAETQRNEAKNRLRQIASDIVVFRAQLRTLLNTTELPDIEEKELSEISVSFALDTTLISSNPSLAYSRAQIEVAANEKKLQNSKASPDFILGYFNQTLIGTTDPESGAIANSSQRFSGFQVGIALPIWFTPHQGRIKAAEYNRRIAENNYQSDRRVLASQLEQAFQSFQKNKSSIEYYKTSALPNADLIMKQSQAGFRGGDISYTEYLFGLRSAITIRESYLQTLNDLNQSIIYIEFLSGNK